MLGIYTIVSRFPHHETGGDMGDLIRGDGFLTGAEKAKQKEKE
jgi:hypothetical protein